MNVSPPNVGKYCDIAIDVNMLSPSIALELGGELKQESLLLARVQILINLAVLLVVKAVTEEFADMMHHLGVHTFDLIDRPICCPLSLDFDCRGEYVGLLSYLRVLKV